MRRQTLRWMVGSPLVVLIVAWAAGCASAGGPASSPTDQWLATKGFEARSDWPSTALHLRKPQMRSTRRISELLRGVRGVRLQPSRENPLGLRRVLDGGQGVCALKVYLNGVPLVTRDPDAQVDLDGRVGVPGLDGLELHLGADGPVYDPDGCGALLLWDQSLRPTDDPVFQGSVRGRVVGQEDGVEVSVRLGDHGPVQSAGPHGTFLFTGLLPGAYELDFVIEGVSVARQPVRVYAEREARLEVRVSRGGD